MTEPVIIQALNDDGTLPSVARAEVQGIAGDAASAVALQLVSGAVALDGSGPPVREYFTTGQTVFTSPAGGLIAAAGTAIVWRRGSGGTWGYRIIDDWTTPTSLAITDTFNRADSDTLGTTETGGKVWAVPTGVSPKIVSNKAAAGGVSSPAVIDAGYPAGRVAAQIAPSGATAWSASLLIRVQDASNWLDITLTKGGGVSYVKLRRRVGGVSADLWSDTTINPLPNTAYLVEAILDGTSVTVKINGAAVHTAVVAELATATKYGFAFYNDTASRVDDFEVTP